MSDILNNVKEELSLITLYLMRSNPFYGVLLKNLNIYFDPETTVVPAYVENLNLYLTREFLRWSRTEKLFIIVHELNHILLKHSIRMKEYFKKYTIDPQSNPQLKFIINIVLDAKCNQYNEIRLPTTSRLDPIYPRTLSVRLFNNQIDVIKLEQMSAEEILDLLFKNIPSVKPNCAVFEDVRTEGNKNSIQIQSGGDEKEDKEEEGSKSEQEAIKELEKTLTRKVLQAYSIAKSIGKIPGRIETIIEELLKPQVNWKTLLRNAIMKGLGKNVKRTWTRPSRKYPLFPGKELLKTNKVIVLVDTSGSISEQELQQFVSEVYSIVKETSDVVVIFWDADVQGETTLKRPSDIKKIKITGRGGTQIYPALEYATKKYKDGVYVIFSDFYIGDLYSSRVEKLLQKVKPICVTTSIVPNIPGLERNIIKIKT